jgi:hypothetical protein
MLRRITIAILLAAPLVFAQNAENKGNTTGGGPAQTENQPAAGRIRDERVSVENVTFWKKNSSDGKGDYLEFTFDIVNKSDDNIPLKMFVLAFNEKDLVDGEYRRYVEYPRWRKWDEDKKTHKLVLFGSIPVTKHEDVAAFARKKEEAVAKSGGFKPKEEPQQNAATGKKKPTLKDFLHYVQYIHENPTTGVDVLLQGYENAVYTLKCEDIAGAKQTGKDECFRMQKKAYLLEEKALKSNLWGRVLSPYQGDRKFFNHIGIVLYDTETKKIVHRQFYSINGRFKVL